MKTTTIATMLLALSITIAQAQQQTFRNANGQVTGSAVTNNAGTTFYDNMGRNTGRSVTNSAGTTTFYDRAGRTVGTASPRR